MPTLRNKRTKPPGYRRTHDKFYNRQPWRKLREWKLKLNPLCEVCEKQGTVKAATVVDHDKPRRFWPQLALCLWNLVSMCDSCHAKKSGIEARCHDPNQWYYQIGKSEFKR